MATSGQLTLTGSSNPERFAHDESLRRHLPQWNLSHSDPMILRFWNDNVYCAEVERAIPGALACEVFSGSAMGTSRSTFRVPTFGKAWLVRLLMLVGLLCGSLLHAQESFGLPRMWPEADLAKMTSFETAARTTASACPCEVGHVGRFVKAFVDGTAPADVRHPGEWRCP